MFLHLLSERRVAEKEAKMVGEREALPALKGLKI
jgi:hypothetical protein